MNRRPHFTEALSPWILLPWGRCMGLAHAVFPPPGVGMPRESIHRSLACASAIQPLDQPFRQSSILRATSPLGAVHGLGKCRFRSPRVWYDPGIDPPISRSRFGRPTAGPSIPFSHVTPRPVTCPRCASAGGPPRPRATIMRVFIPVPGHQWACGGIWVAGAPWASAIWLYGGGPPISSGSLGGGWSEGAGGGFAMRWDGLRGEYA